ncbi:MAG: RecX family transcriptional regulator [Chloroflexi bacterium]|nr:MAG: RecX family transcriptional regulator [Chloroflexota bacterium]
MADATAGNAGAGNVITGLVIQQHSKERVNVFLDGEYAFAVGLDAALGLRKGQRLSAEQIAALKHEGEVDLAYQRSLRYLGIRPRSEQEMSTYLAGKGYAEEVTAAVLARLRARGYVDDAAFARYWVDSRTRFRPRGTRALRYELRQKGLDSPTIDEALEEQDEDAAAWAAAAPKAMRWAGLPREEFDKKLIGFLARRGFAYAICRRVAERAWQEYQEG